MVPLLQATTTFYDFMSYIDLVLDSTLFHSDLLL